MTTCQIIVVDDDRRWRELLAETLRGYGYHVLEAGSGAEAVRMVAEASPALVLLDWQLPDQNGIETLRQIRQLRVEAEVVMFTAFVSSQLAVQSIKEGALDFISKSAEMSETLVVVRRSLETVLQRRKTAHLTAERYRGLILGNSEQIRFVHHQISEAAQANAPVLVTGETGTGKELVARAIVSGSERQGRPFVTVDCTTLARELIESELFGHERGAFTGAYRRKQGQLELADRGTVFLDEIGELELPLQAKLLRVLERKEFLRVGGVAPIKVDVRVIAATNRDLAGEIKAGRFRADLFYRLHVVDIHLPPLRERTQDIPLLAEHFLGHFAREIRKPIIGFREGALECLLRYQWPGNVRELENTIQRMVIFGAGPLLGFELLPQEILRTLSAHRAPPSGLDQRAGSGESLVESGKLSLNEATRLFRRQYIEQALRSYDGKVDLTAKALKVNRTHLYKILKDFELDQ